MNNFSDFFTQSSIRIREKNLGRIKSSKKNSKFTERIIYLTTVIPEWQKYLTIKQRESLTEFIHSRNCDEIDAKMKLRIGTTYERLFSKYDRKYNPTVGAIGRLEQAHIKLFGDSLNENVN